MDGSKVNVAQNMPTDTDRLGLQILAEHISSASFHDSHQRLNETNLTIVKKWVQKWTPRLRSSDLSSIKPQRKSPEKVIVDVFAWLFDLSSPSPIMWIHHEDRSQSIFFAHTIADILDDLDKLSGSFFSSKPDRLIDITRIIPTIAFQLAQNVPGTRSLIAQTVLRNNLIFDLRAKSQIKKLIVDPLLFALTSGNMETTGVPNVFLIHGLDEFDNAGQSQLSLLDAFSDALTILATNSIPYRLLLVGQHSSYIKRSISISDLGQKVLECPIVIPVALGEEVQDGGMKRKRSGEAWHLMKTLEGHTSSVNAITFSPDGTRLASASSDTTVRLWEGESGSLVAVLERHTRPVGSLAFSADGTSLVSGSHSGRVCLWEGKTGILIAAFQGHSGVVRSLAFSPGGLRLASGSHDKTDKTVRLWEGKTGSLIAALEGHTNKINDIAFSADGSILASGSGDGTIRLWDGNTGSLITILKDHSASVYTLAFSPCGSTLASGSFDKTVRLWEGKTGRLVATLEGHTSTILDVAFSPDGSIIASGSLDTTVRLWDVETESLAFTLQGHSSSVLSVAFSADGSILASRSDDETVRLWNVDARNNITTLKGSSYIRSVVFSPDGLRLATAFQDGTGQLWH